VESQPPNYFVHVRFWGKILARERDYYVCEAQLRKYYSEDLPSDSEQPGTGINEYAHYVTNDILEEWDMLPFITKK
jgi:radial spoke head protein 4/6